MSLVAVIGADTILGIQDFRADEKALQLMNQLMGRTGRRLQQGKLIIQTSQKEHPVLQSLLKGDFNNPDNLHNPCGTTKLPSITAQLLGERQQFMFAPYVRMVKIMAKHKDAAKLQELCSQIQEKLQGRKDLEYKEFTGPFTPVIDKIRGEYIKCFFIKFARNSHLSRNKQVLLECINGIKGYNSIIVDVDPLY